MRFSDLTQRIAGDGAAAWDIHYRALALREQGHDILLLSVGDPDFDTPAPIVQAAIDSLLAGNTHYADVRGKRTLRDAIARRQQARSGQAVTSEQVIVLAGAQCALFSVAQCVLNPGDEVLVAEPMYVTYEAVFGACGAVVIPVPVRSENGFRVMPEDVAARITPRTRALALNSPHNPSGASLPRSTWQALAELCIGHDLWLISDEVYSELLFDGEHLSPASLPGMAERTATLNSLSKSHAMTGWRIGWVVAPPALASHLENLALCMLYGLPDFVQDAAVVALDNHLPELAVMREAYRQRRDLVCAVLADCPGVRALKPDGGMFVMLDIRATGLSAQAFADRLLERHGVSVLAGEAFGPSAAGHIRLGLVVDTEQLREACQRIARCAHELMEAQAHA
ncbi:MULTISPECIES: pyridoxal phosphate-dependent aminotransferase [Pseudomonas]|jgi:arginine:pyruvate transaminase|uniref:Aminotransferase n=1 Tax=Pseudomonas kielensis TaxID=2762577 RepID=A0A7X1GIN4_9PSED|nr:MULTISPECIES: aminotransferase class I/II-fold pyridoxal phosphate-dependent enzyme [Pseudomonas]MBC2693147.1 aminotransferase class I/II-fold pyridoxal phosphate-dependent enzyme [Pseudomonas kielensis]NBB37098.1 aminotransferase class I/II-fold pyridoxal phosphate-dependent enzyme [Pseudomonas sp. BC115LW]UZM15416.1 aminotransferase class I/II-fold pyridoxal phosphate-dependent enzyme [Pseudomonas kielensis]